MRGLIRQCYNGERQRERGRERKKEGRCKKANGQLELSILAVKRRRRKYPLVKMDLTTLPRPWGCSELIELSTNCCDRLGGVGGALGKAGKMHKIFVHVTCDESCDYILPTTVTTISSSDTPAWPDK